MKCNILTLQKYTSSRMYFSIIQMTKVSYQQQFFHNAETVTQIFQVTWKRYFMDSTFLSQYSFHQSVFIREVKHNEISNEIITITFLHLGFLNIQMLETL
jgi:hypothetical protein